MAVFLGTPCNLGLKPYDDGSPRRVDEAPDVLRRLRLPERLGARDAGDVAAGAYVDVDRVPGEIRNTQGLTEYAQHVADAVGSHLSDGPLIVAGGDCSILLGALLALRRAGRFGLVYLDAHRDFATPAISGTGAAAGMVLALAAGRFAHPLAALDARGALLHEEDIVLLGRKDHADDVDYRDAPIGDAVLDIDIDDVLRGGPAAAAVRALERVADARLDGFWIHFDVDVLRTDVISAVDSPEPGGLTYEDAGALLRALWQSPRVCGIDVTIYDPGLDPSLAEASRLADLLAAALGPRQEQLL